MLLLDVFDALKYGELSQLSIGGEASGVVSKANYPAIATSINAGLVALYTRFLLKEGSGYLAPQPGKYEYALTDSGLAKLERIYTDAGFECGLNDLGNPYAIITNGPRSIYVPPVIVDQPSNTPLELRTTGLRYVFRALHPRLDTDASSYSDIEDITLELPDGFMDALLYYVASRHTTPQDMTGQFHSGNNYSAKYEQACKLLEAVNLSVDRVSSAPKFFKNGWV